MNTQTKFPLSIMAEDLDTPQIELEGQKVVFDKKVSLLPVNSEKRTKKTKDG